MRRTATTWRKELEEVLKYRNETWSDVESNTMTEEDMDKEFDPGFGGTEGCGFTVWTKNTIYLPATYDGAEWVVAVSRNPDGLPTPHIGGG